MIDVNPDRQIERLSKLSDNEPDNDHRQLTVEERWHMMWPLAVSAWAMKGINIAEQEFQRDVECLKRVGR
jgi:hypothetical protein